MNREAIGTHGLNLFPGRPAHTLPLDITRTSFQDVMTLFGHAPDKGSVDVVIGGPPCQAFTRIGRAKLRELAGGRKEAHLVDNRARLYEDYLRFVEDAEPLVVVMENVCDFLNFGGRNLAEEICCDLDRLNYRSAYTHLNTAQFGVPQFRERVFIIAVHKELGLDPNFPMPTHRSDLPQGYHDIRAGLDAYRLAGAAHAHRYPGTPEGTCLAAVTARDALVSLPSVDPLKEVSKKYRPREWVKVYTHSVFQGEYDRLMRKWEPMESPSVLNHAARTLPRDGYIFKAMKYGDQYPEAHAFAVREWTRKCLRDGLDEIQSAELKKKMVPPYKPDKFPNKWRKLHPDEPVRTLTAHLGKDSYSHIHFDSKQARTITVREAARLQSFHDGFHFVCGLNAAFTQIGNAVPPLMSAALGKTVLGILGLAAETPPARTLVGARG